MVFLFAKKVIFSAVLFIIMYPLGGCKSQSGNSSSNTTLSGNLTLSSPQERQFLKRFKHIIHLKAGAKLLQDCNTTKDKLYAEIIKKYKRMLKNMSSSGVKRTKIRIKDFVRENKNGSYTLTSTNQRKNKIFFKNNHFLFMDDSGKVSGTKTVTDKNKNNTIFYVKSTGQQVMMVQSFKTKKYISMDKHGHVYAKTTPDHESLFYHQSEENLFQTLASYKYYLTCPYDMFLAIKDTGYIKSPYQSVPGQSSTQFMLVPVQ